MTQQTSAVSELSMAILRLARTRFSRLCSAFYYIITIALLYYTIIIVINRTGNSNCFDVPCQDCSLYSIEPSCFLAFSVVTCVK